MSLRSRGIHSRISASVGFTVVFVVLFLIGFTGGLFYASPSKPLYNLTMGSIPEGLQWYPVAVFGDNRPAFTHYIKYNSVFYQIIDDIRTLNPYAVIGTGDHVGEGRSTQYEELYKTLEGLENVWLVPGNHDYHWPGSRNFWRDYVGPADYLARLPGWTFIMVDGTVDNATRFNETLSLLFRSATANGDKLVLVEHYPIEPWVDHNLNQTEAGPQKQEAIINYIREYNVTLVLQGHWHGYAEKRDNNTLYIITGGAGAPLYSRPRETDADKIITGLYHYMVFIFYSNGTYTYTTVYPKYGDLEKHQLNETTILLYNTRYTLERKPASLPFRFNLTFNNETVTILAIVDSGSPQLVKLANTNPLTIEATPGVHSIEALLRGKPATPIVERVPLEEAVKAWNALKANTSNTGTSGNNTLNHEVPTVRTPATATAGTSAGGGETIVEHGGATQSETGQQTTTEQTEQHQVTTATGKPSIANAASMLALAVVAVLIAAALVIRR